MSNDTKPLPTQLKYARAANAALAEAGREALKLQEPIKVKGGKFRPYRRAQTDGGKRPRSNGDNADEAVFMLALVADSEHLADDEKLVDALTNLRHWAHREGVDFEHSVQSSEMHWDAEK